MADQPELEELWGAAINLVDAVAASEEKGEHHLHRDALIEALKDIRRRTGMPTSDYTNDTHIEQGPLAIMVGNNRRGTVEAEIVQEAGPMPFMIRTWRPSRNPAHGGANIETGITTEEASAIGKWLCAITEPPKRFSRLRARLELRRWFKP
jgi:hypothetical protein